MRCLQLSVLISLQITFSYATILRTSLRCLALDTVCVKALTQSFESHFIQGIPGVGTVRLDPLVVDYVKHEQNGLALEIKDSKFEGFKNWILDELSPKTNLSMGRALFRTDVIATGLYKIDGSLLFIPIKGNGDYTITMRDMELEVLGPKLVINNIDGEEYVELSNSDYTFDYNVKDDAQFRFNDHYFGSTLFNEVLNYLLSYNWKFPSSEFGKAFMAKIVDKVSQIHKYYF